jgi:hypothetical protein
MVLETFVELFAKRLRNLAAATAILAALGTFIVVLVMRVGLWPGILTVGFGALGGYLSILLLWIAGADQLRRQDFHW